MPDLLKVIAGMESEIGRNNLLPASLFKLLHYFDPRMTYEDMAKFVLTISDAESLLTTKSSRNIIIEHLSEQETRELSAILGISNSSNPWQDLKTISFQNGSSSQSKLFQYFELIPPSSTTDTATESAHVVIDADYPLFPHQIRAISEVKSKLNSQDKKVLLHMPTGSGKTRTAMHVICDFVRNLENPKDSLVIWLAHSEELCDQAFDELEKSWKSLGNGKLSVHKRYGAFSDSYAAIDNGVLISGLDMMRSRLNTDTAEFRRIARKTKLLIFDEAHMALAPSYNDITEQLLVLGQAALLGLSATPGRSTYDFVQNNKFADMFAHNKVTLKVDGFASPIDFLQKEGFLSKVSYLRIPYEPETINIERSDIEKMQGGAEIPDFVLRSLGLDEKRNIKILNTIIEQAKMQKFIIVFAPSVDAAMTINFLLRHNGFKSGVVTSSTSSLERQTTIQDYKDGKLQIIVNFGVLTTGFDAPRTNVAIIARPTNSLVLYSQMVGRATRGPAVKGNAESTVFTVTDALPGFRDLSQAFQHWDDAW